MDCWYIISNVFLFIGMDNDELLPSHKILELDLSDIRSLELTKHRLEKMNLTDLQCVITKLRQIVCSITDLQSVFDATQHNGNFFCDFLSSDTVFQLEKWFDYKIVRDNR